MNCVVISPGMYTYGSMLIAGVISDAGHHVSLRKELTADSSDVVFLSLFSTQHLTDDNIRSFITRHRGRGGKCFVGGPVSAYPEMVLGELDCDAVVTGEGEDTVREILAGFHTGMEGTASRSNDDIIMTPRQPPASISHPVPFIPEDIGNENIRGASAYIETHRGCIGACTFCQVPRFFGREIRSREIDEILNEVRAFRDKGAKKLSISGGTGSLFQYSNGMINEGAFIELLEGMADIMGPKNISSPDIRVDCISDDILEAIEQYTIGWIFFGLESGSDRILQLMGKGADVGKAKEAIIECRNHNLKIAGSFIVGHPLETTDDFEDTKDFITENPLDDVFISIAEPIPKTPLADLVLKTDMQKNPTFRAHEGEYRSLNLRESEARAFDLMMHADLYKPGVHVVTDDIFTLYLNEVKKDGEIIRSLTELLFRYYS